MLTPTIPADSVCRLLYTGEIGVSGVDQTVSIDLTDLPEDIRTDPNFRDNWRVFVRQVDDGVSAVSAAIDFTPASPATPTAMTLVATASATSDTLALEAVFTPTSVR